MYGLRLQSAVASELLLLQFNACYCNYSCYLQHCNKTTYIHTFYCIELLFA